MPIKKKLSERVCVGADAQPWVLDEIKVIEAHGAEQEDLVRDLALLIVHLIRRMRKFLELDGASDAALEFLRRKKLDPSYLREGERDIIDAKTRRPYGWTVHGSNRIYTGPYAEMRARSEAEKAAGESRVIALYSDEGVR